MMVLSRFSLRAMQEVIVEAQRHSGKLIVPTLRRGNAFGNAPALLTVTPERHSCIPTPERGNDKKFLKL
jgi:hypothetical protein